MFDYWECKDNDDLLPYYTENDLDFLFLTSTTGYQLEETFWNCGIMSGLLFYYYDGKECNEYLRGKFDLNLDKEKSFLFSFLQIFYFIYIFTKQLQSNIYYLSKWVTLIFYILE